MSASLAHMIRRVRRRYPAGDVCDASLLARWAAGDQAAFELLVWRHGPMVWDTCQRILRHDHDAEDAFQAVFITLARKADSIQQSTSLAGWLYRVAHRAALTAHSRRATHDELDDVVHARRDDAELRLHLDEEIALLPQRYREPFVLCYLQGLTTDEAANALGLPRGTVGTRVAWARRRLCDRLSRQGIALPATLPLAPVPAVLVESVMSTIHEPAAPAVASLIGEIVTMLFIDRVRAAALWLAPLLIVAVGFTGLALTPAHAQKPDAKKPADKDKPKPADAVKKNADIQGVVKAVSNDGKTVTVITAKKTKEDDEKTTELKLNDKTTVRFSGVGIGEANVKEGQFVMAWLAENSKDTAANVVFTGDKTTKGAKAGLNGPIGSVADDGKSFVITLTDKLGNDVSRNVKLTDKTVHVFQYVGLGAAKAAEGLIASVIFSEGSDETAARVMYTAKVELPSKKNGGDNPAHNGVVTAVAKDGKSFTLLTGGKQGEEGTKVELKIGQDSKVYFAGVGPGEAKIKEKTPATVWVNDGAKDTAAIAVFHSDTASKYSDLVGKVVGVADDGKSFTLLTQGKKDGNEIKIVLTEKSLVVFNGVPTGGARISKDLQAQVSLTEGSKETAASVLFGAGKK